MKLSVFLLAIYAFHYISADSGPFKINKLNLIWSKAEHSLGQSKLKDLKADLSKHESDELSLKKMKAHNQDKDGLFEAVVRKKLHSLMSKYKLERYYDDVHPAPATVEDDPKKDVNGIQSPNTQPTFRDSRLEKLWKKAEKSGFTQEQLMVLHEEFQHQQDRLDDHYETMNIIENELESRMNEQNRYENSIEADVHEKKSKKTKSNKDKESPADKRARLYQNMHQGLKDKYSDIKRDLEVIHRNIILKKAGDSGGPFELEIVNELWASAEQSNFNQAELDSFKEELGHYETRLKKLDHFQNQLERNQIINKGDTSDEDKETKHLRKRVEELTHKADKTRKSLEKRIVKAREEL